MADSIERASMHKLVLIGGRSNPELTQGVAECLNIEILPSQVFDFANGEIYVHYEETIRGADVFVLQTHSDPINKNIMEQLIMIDALKRSSARSVTAVIPCLGYARQDKKHIGREPITAKLMLDLYKTAGANRIITIDLHSSQIQGFFDGPVDHLEAMTLLANYISHKIDPETTTMVSPDAGRIKVSEKWAKKLGGLQLAFVHKTRDYTKANSSTAGRVIGDVEGKTCLLVDDLIDTGGTIVNAIESLKDAGAKDIYVLATHGYLSAPAKERLQNCPAKEVVVTNSLAIEDDKKFEKLTILSIAPLIAKSIRAVFDESSVAPIFEEIFSYDIKTLF
jgi:ribose-phosphate pyrophosphokinase